MKFITIISSLALISSTVTALALPNKQDLVTRDNEELEARINIAACFKCISLKALEGGDCHKVCS